MNAVDATTTEMGNLTMTCDEPMSDESHMTEFSDDSDDHALVQAESDAEDDCDLYDSGTTAYLGLMSLTALERKMQNLCTQSARKDRDFQEKFSDYVKHAEDLYGCLNEAKSVIITAQSCIEQAVGGFYDNERLRSLSEITIAYSSGQIAEVFNYFESVGTHLFGNPNHCGLLENSIKTFKALKRSQDQICSRLFAYYEHHHQVRLHEVELSQRQMKSPPANPFM
eukprot:TRINITY_DN384603_c0_g1_i1.p1 TRINITY_DN384603_c0_g1~~TRINITY_DN384603_c0_g1_i1.p1  ORF type:complete len:225 (+),score=8.96 TRINITY_DN384603_c0_g1_i1:99-773(+)